VRASLRVGRSLSPGILGRVFGGSTRRRYCGGRRPCRQRGFASKLTGRSDCNGGCGCVGRWWRGIGFGRQRCFGDRRRQGIGRRKRRWSVLQSGTTFRVPQARDCQVASYSYQAYHRKDDCNSRYCVYHCHHSVGRPTSDTCPAPCKLSGQRCPLPLLVKLPELNVRHAAVGSIPCVSA